MERRFEQDIKGILPQVIAWRRHFHQYPEISFQEVETTKLIVQEMKSWGIWKSFARQLPESWLGCAVLNRDRPLPCGGY